MFENNVRKIRESKGFSQQQLADMLGCRRETVSNIENGKNEPTLGLVMDLCYALDSTFGEIFGGIAEIIEDDRIRNAEAEARNKVFDSIMKYTEAMA